MTPDFSAAYTLNAGKMDAIVRVQLTEERKKGSYEYADQLRKAFAAGEAVPRPGVRVQRRRPDPRRPERGKTTPINVRVTGKNMKTAHGSPTRSAARWPTSKGWSTAGSSSGSTIPSTSSTWIGPRPPTSG